MKHKFLQLDPEPKFLNMSKGSRENDIENLFPIVTKSSIFFITCSTTCVGLSRKAMVKREGNKYPMQDCCVRYSIRVAYSRELRTHE